MPEGPSSGPAAETATRSVVQLDYSDRGGVVTVTPRDQDRFNLSVHRAIEACAKAVAEDKFRSQLNILAQRLGRWLSGRTGIRAAYVTLRDSEFLFLVVRDSSAYDRQFSDDLSALDRELANDIDLSSLQLDTMAVPNVSVSALSTFLSPSFSVELVHGERN